MVRGHPADHTHEVVGNPRHPPQHRTRNGPPLRGGRACPYTRLGHAASTTAHRPTTATNKVKTARESKSSASSRILTGHPLTTPTASLLSSAASPQASPSARRPRRFPGDITLLFDKIIKLDFHIRPLSVLVWDNSRTHPSSILCHWACQPKKCVPVVGRPLRMRRTKNLQSFHGCTAIQAQINSRAGIKNEQLKIRIPHNNKNRRMGMATRESALMRGEVERLRELRLCGQCLKLQHTEDTSFATEQHIRHTRHCPALQPGVFNSPARLLHPRMQQPPQPRLPIEAPLRHLPHGTPLGHHLFVSV